MYRKYQRFKSKKYEKFDKFTISVLDIKQKLQIIHTTTNIF